MIPRVRQPSIHELGSDLLCVSPRNLLVAIGRPFLCFGAYWFFAYSRWWVPAILAVAGLQFFTYTSASHDLVHRTLRIPRGINESLLALSEGLAMRSGHAFRITHLHHHRHLAAESDVEANGATGSLWQALLCGPGYQTRLFRWAWARARGNERRWMTLEAGTAFVFGVAAILLWSSVPQLGIYALLVTTSAWFYPAATVWWPHHGADELTLTGTRAFRGDLLPALLFQHTYHLEHHLYPMVPAHQWAELGRRLDPYLCESGVVPVQLP